MNWSNPTKTPFSLKYSLKVNAHECQRQIYCEVWPRILLTLWSQTDFQVKFRCKEKSKERSESQKPVVFYVFVRGHKEWDNQRMRDKRDVETLSGPRQVTDTAPATCGVHCDTFLVQIALPQFSHTLQLHLAVQGSYAELSPTQIFVF